MKVYYGIVVPENIIYEAIAYTKYGTKDLDIFANRIVDDKMGFNFGINSLYNIYKNEFEFGTLTRYIKQIREGVNIMYLESNLSVDKCSPVFIGYHTMNRPNNLLYLGEIPTIVKKEQRENVDYVLEKLGLNQFPAKLMIHIAEDGDVYPPPDYQDYTKNKI